MNSALSQLSQRYPWPAEKPDVPEDPHGWFGEDNERVLKKYLHDDMHVIVELGSWLGKSTRFLLECCPQAVVIAIDHWTGSHEHRRRQQPQLQTLYETFLANCWPQRARLIPLRAHTLTGLMEIAELRIRPDLIYVDASHDYNSVIGDIMVSVALFPKAVIAGDDWNWGRERPVRRAAQACADVLGRRIDVCGNAWSYVPELPPPEEQPRSPASSVRTSP